MKTKDFQELQVMLWRLRSFVESEWVDGPDKNLAIDDIEIMMLKVEREINARRSTKNITDLIGVHTDPNKPARKIP